MIIIDRALAERERQGKPVLLLKHSQTDYVFVRR